MTNKKIKCIDCNSLDVIINDKGLFECENCYKQWTAEDRDKQKFQRRLVFKNLKLIGGKKKFTHPLPTLKKICGLNFWVLEKEYQKTQKKKLGRPRKEIKCISCDSLNVTKWNRVIFECQDCRRRWLEEHRCRQTRQRKRVLKNLKLIIKGKPLTHSLPTLRKIYGSSFWVFEKEYQHQRNKIRKQLNKGIKA